jgi:hypothetical protein
MRATSLGKQVYPDAVTLGARAPRSLREIVLQVGCSVVAPHMIAIERAAAHLAAWGRHISTLCVIIQLDPSIMRAADVFGHTPVHFCAWSGQLEALRMLHRLDASLVLQRTHAWSNAAHLAALSPHAHGPLSLLADIAPESLQAPDLVGMVPAQLCKAWCAHAETQVNEVEQMMGEVSLRDSCVGGAR